MRSVYTGIIILILLALVIPSAYALPTTQDVAFSNSSTVLFYATTCACPCFYKYGTLSQGDWYNYTWQTDNQTNVSALNYIWEKGVPLMAGTKFYYRACDITGCGGQKFVTLPVVTVAPTTTFNVLATNITRSRFDLAIIGVSIIEPYTWVTYNPNITFGVLLFFVFIGIWLRQRELIIPVLLGMIASGLLLYQGANSVGIPPEMLIIVVGIVAVALTGVVLGLLKR